MTDQLHGTRVVHFSSVHKVDDVRVFMKECRSLAAAGYDVTLIARGEGSDIVDGVRRIGIGEMRFGRLGRMIGGVLRVAVLAWQQRADIYHFHDPELLPVGLFFKMTGKRVIYDAHESIRDQVKSKPWLRPQVRPVVSKAVRWLEDFSVKRFDGVVAATHAIGAILESDHTIVVPNYPLLEELVVDDDFTPRDSNIVLFTGGLTKIRGAVEMIRAIAIVNDRVPARLRVLGNAQAGLKSALVAEPGWAYVDELGMKPRSVMLDELKLATCGLCVYLPEPNHVEAQPNKLFEYMGAGLPVIASDFPLWRELVDGAGVCVSPVDAEDIAKGILRVLTDPEGARQMGEAGRARIREGYNWACSERHLIHIYDRLASS